MLTRPVHDYQNIKRNNHYDKYQKLALSYGLLPNYIYHWSNKLKVSKATIINDIINGETDHLNADPYSYKSHECKFKISLSNQPYFLKVKFKTYQFCK
jgi:transcriptional antiterminator